MEMDDGWRWMMDGDGGWMKMDDGWRWLRDGDG